MTQIYLKYTGYPTSAVQIAVQDSADTSIEKVHIAKPFPEDLHVAKSNTRIFLHGLYEAQCLAREQKKIKNTLDPDTISWNFIGTLGRYGINPVKERMLAQHSIFTFLRDAPGELQKKVGIVEECIKASENQSVTDFVKNCETRFARS